MEDKKIKIFSDFYLPIQLVKYTNKEYKDIYITYQLDEAKNIGIQRAEEELNKQVEDKMKILNKNINVNEKDEYVEVEVTYEVRESIGTKEKIVF